LFIAEVTGAQPKPQLVKRAVVAVQRLAPWVLVLLAAQAAHLRQQVGVVEAAAQVDHLQLLAL
jgi:hypothetical protein